jgi:hypothetical protein
MPINAGPEYYAAEKRYLEAKTREEKIRTLEEMIRFLPKHKGTSNVLAQLKKRLAKLKSQKSGKATSKPRFSIRKMGSGQVCILGLTNSGKSTLLKALTDIDIEIADYPYTTTNPKVAMMPYGDIQIQLIEIPSTFDPESLGLLYTCDEILVLIDASEDFEKQKGILQATINERKLNKKILYVINKSDLKEIESKHIKISAKNETGLKGLKDEIWNNLDLIRIYTKSPGKPKIIPPITLPKDSTVKDVAKNVHHDFIKNFKFARIFNDTKFSGSSVGLDYKLKDLDVVEIRS